MRKHFLFFIAASFLASSVSGQTLERIQETGVMKLGYRTDAAPLSFAQENGAPAGYAPQICLRVAQGMVNTLKLADLDVQFVQVDASNRFEMVANGDVDLLCGAATITLERRTKVDFSIPVFVDGTALMVPKETSPKFSELAGQKLGVRGGTTTEQALNNSLKAANLEAEVITFDSHRDGMAAMEVGNINAYFADQSILARLMMQSSKPDAFHMSSEILTIEKQGLAMARGDADFRLLVDTEISKMYANGEMQRLFQDNIPGVNPGIALRAMYLLAPTLE